MSMQGALEAVGPVAAPSQGVLVPALPDQSILFYVPICRHYFSSAFSLRLFCCLVFLYRGQPALLIKQAVCWLQLCSSEPFSKLYPCTEEMKEVQKQRVL